MFFARFPSIDLFFWFLKMITWSQSEIICLIKGFFIMQYFFIGIIMLCLAYISRLTPKCRMICRLTPKSCVMYAGLRLAKTFVCCCPDQLNKRLTDSKIESVRRKLCSVRTKSTFVVASSQSQRVAFMTRSATVTFAINNYGGLVDWRTRIAVH